jgi:hypothetical protein
LEYNVNGEPDPLASRHYNDSAFSLWVSAKTDTGDVDLDEHIIEHDSASCSGIYYSQAEKDATPVVFSDPRGGSVADSRGRETQRFQPGAPFHHQYYVFPGTGDLVLFPPYVPHAVPRSSHRVAWYFNLGPKQNWWESNFT